jgi:hypothetical protein
MVTCLDETFLIDKKEPERPEVSFIEPSAAL